MRRGDLDQAERIAPAEALNPGQKRMPWIVIGLIERERGRIERAIELFARANTIPVGHILSLNRRADAMIDRDLAVLHAELGHRETALSLLRQAEPEFAGDTKLRVTYDASAALVHALGHDREQFAVLTSLRPRRALTTSVTMGRLTGRAYLLGRAALEIDEPKRAESFLLAYLELNPNPLYLPYAHYHLAECRRMLGDAAEGAHWTRRRRPQESATSGEHLARERLASDSFSV